MFVAQTSRGMPAMTVCFVPMDHGTDMRPRHRDVERHFARAADGFDSADFIHRIAGGGLLERMAPMQVEPKRILDLGAGTGTLSRRLAKVFRRSHVLSLDLSHAMLRRARKGRGYFSRISELQADAAALPLPAMSVDVVVANLLLPHLPDADALFAEVARVLQKGGLFAFATLGPDSLRELREAWDDDGHVQRFPDMHDVGDALVRAGLRDPVLDVDHLGVDYRSTGRLFGDLTACGARNALPGRRKSLTGKSRFRRAESVLAGRMLEGPLKVSIELVYGHAWGGGPRPGAGEFRLDIADIGRRGRPR